MFKRVCKLDSVSCHRISNLDDDDDDVSSSSLLLPLPRASHSLNFVTDYLVLFGGGREGGLKVSFLSFCFEPIVLLCFFVSLQDDILMIHGRLTLERATTRR